MNEKKERIILAAKELFSTYGFYKVSMNEIAKKSKITKKTIYTYFKDKNDLINVVLIDEINSMKKLADKIDKKNISFEDKTHEIITMQLDYRNNSKILCNYIKELEEGRFKNNNENIFNKSILSELETRLDEAIKDGYIKKCDTKIVSFLIYKIYIALMFELDYDIDKKEVTENIMDILKVWLLK